MSDNREKSISEKIEDTVEGILRFISRLLLTTWIIFRHPFTCWKILLNADRSERVYVLPLTYLAVGGFVFTLVISAYPFGLLNILDVIWFDDEVGKNIYQRWSEALSITGLLTAAFPVLLSMALFTAILAKLFGPQEDRDQFKLICYYAFGYQSLLFFFMFFAAIGLDLIYSAVIGPYHPPEYSEIFVDQITNVLLIFIVLFFLSPLLTPTIMLTAWRVDNFKSSRTILSGIKVLLMPCVAIIGLVIISYSASLPAIFKEKVDAKAPTIVLDRIGDDEFRITRNATGEFIAHAKVNMVINNKPSEILYAEASDVELFLNLERDSNENAENWFGSNVHVSHNNQGIEFIQIAKEEAEIYNVSSEIELPKEAIELLRFKAFGGSDANNMGFFLTTRLTKDSVQYDRKVAVSASDALSDVGIYD